MRAALMCVGLVCAVGCKKGEQLHEAATEAEVLPVLRAYAENPAKGDEQYQGKLLRMRIPGVEMVRENGETIAVHSPGGTVPTRHMQFHFMSEKDVAELKPRTAYTISGRCEGLSGNTIVFRSCAASETR